MADDNDSSTLLDTAAASGTPAAPPQPQGDVAPPTDATAAPALTQTADEWFLADGVKGADARPEWFKADKYKSVADQAKAYVELEKRFGETAARLKGFTGAPEKYELSVPEDLKDAMEWTGDDPLLSEFQAFAKESGMSQQTFDKALHMLAKYEYTQQVIDHAQEKSLLGERADDRLRGFTDWARANLSDEQFAAIAKPLSKHTRPHEVFKAFEVLMEATRQPAITPPADDVRTGMTKDDWQSKWYAKSDVPGHKYRIDEPGAREKARAELEQIVGTGDVTDTRFKGGFRRAS